MTPSRALLILRRGVLSGGHERRREALPWWIFGLVGAWLTLSYGSSLLAGSQSPTIPASEGAWNLPGGTSWLWAIPGAIAGLILGWLCIGPVNRLLGWVF